MRRTIVAKPLTPQAFKAFGEVIQKDGSNNFAINNGKCIRHHDLAKIETAGEGGHAIISIFAGQPYALPHKLEMVERHPLGSQAFIPMHDRPFLVIVCGDKSGKPDVPKAFVTKSGQGYNLKRNVWHAVLIPLGEPSDFIVVDRGGYGNNLEEYFFDEPYLVELA